MPRDGPARGGHTWEAIVAEDEAPKRSPGRMRLALVLFLLNYLLGWPALVVAGAASPWAGVEASAFVGSALYLLSWVLLAAAIGIGGREVTVIGRRWVAARWRRRSPVD